MPIGLPDAMHSPRARHAFASTATAHFKSARIIPVFLQPETGIAGMVPLAAPTPLHCAPRLPLARNANPAPAASPWSAAHREIFPHLPRSAGLVSFRYPARSAAAVAAASHSQISESLARSTTPMATAPPLFRTHAAASVLNKAKPVRLTMIRQSRHSPPHSASGSCPAKTAAPLPAKTLHSDLLFPRPAWASASACIPQSFASLRCKSP